MRVHGDSYANSKRIVFSQILEVMPEHGDSYEDSKRIVFS
jgi:hypothetical protein